MIWRELLIVCIQDRPFTRAQGNLKKEEGSLPPRPATSMVTEGDVIVFKGKSESLAINFI